MNSFDIIRRRLKTTKKGIGIDDVKHKTAVPWPTRLKQRRKANGCNDKFKPTKKTYTRTYFVELFK